MRDGAFYFFDGFGTVTFAVEAFAFDAFAALTAAQRRFCASEMAFRAAGESFRFRVT